ncbi:MAG: hypothetical protein ACUVS2_11025 [Candidatus Flexifilum sp.]|jgi:glucose-6-phosphate-specific signal transduction histidine kinase
MGQVKWGRVIPVGALLAGLGALLGLLLDALTGGIASVEIGLLVRFAGALLIAPLVYLVTTSLLLAFGVPLGFDPTRQQQRSVHALLYLCVILPAVFVSISV